MAKSTSSNYKTKKEAQNALDRFKMEVASEIGVNLKDGYNGDLTSAEAGSVGGNMVKEMIRRQEEQMSAKGIAGVSESSVQLTGNVNDIQSEASDNNGIAEDLATEVGKFKLE